MVLKSTHYVKDGVFQKKLLNFNALSVKKDYGSS